MFKRLLAAGFFCISLTAQSLFAETTDQQEAFDLGDIVVTTQAVGVADIGISREITREEIKAVNAKTVSDVLKFAPGITVTKGRKNEPEISIHGFGQEKSLFLIDGIPYYETNFGKLSLDQIPASIISRIEITKNAPSVLYGPNAQIAVINVITKMGTEKPTFDVNAEVGENKTYRASASHGNQIGAVNYWLSFIHEQSDGWRMSDDFEPEIAVRARRFMPNVDGVHEYGGFRENSDFNKNRLWARAGITPDDGSEYFVSFHLLDSELGHPPATNEYRIFVREGDVPAFSTFSRFDDYDDWGMDISGKQVLSEALTLRGKLFYHNHEDVYVSYDSPDYDNIIAESTYKDDLLGGSVIMDFNAVDHHEGHVSIHYRQDSHDETDDAYLPFKEFESNTGSVGTEHSYYFQNGFALYGGIAYDWFEIDQAEDNAFDGDDLFTGNVDLETPSTQDEFNPMAGFTWDMDQTTFYGSIARKTQFPTLSQLYSSTSGNPDLTAEKTLNYTLGVTRHFGERFTADFSGFYHDISDWISRDYYEEDYSGNEIYMNVEDVAMMGFETSFKATFTEAFKMNLDYTFNDAENKSDLRATDKVIGVPKHKFGAGFNALIPVVLVSLDMQGIYGSEVYDSLPTTGSPDDPVTESDDYFIINSRLSKKFKDQYEFYAEADNLLDKNYKEEVGFPAQGRNLRVGANLRF
jgi:outer membrane cobalamin receptor